MKLAEQTTTTFADQLNETEIAVFPVGSTEQHGPALPLETDNLLAKEFAWALDRPDVAVLPTLPVGVSEQHRQFHGTLYVRDETFERFVRETLTSIAEHGVQKAVIVNGHGGNTAALHRTARRLRQDETIFAAPWNWWECLDDLPEKLFEQRGAHASAIETSVIYHLAPDLIRPEALDEAEAGAADTWGDTIHGADIGFDTIDFSDSGATGAPTEASPEAGEQLFEQAFEELDALVTWLADQPFTNLLPKEHKSTT